jgi:hypothetical protein
MVMISRWSPTISAISAALSPVPAPISRTFIPSFRSSSSSISATSDGAEEELVGIPSTCVASAVSA